MSHRRRNYLLGVWITTLALLLVLTGALSGLTLLPERTYDLPQSTESTELVLDLTWFFGAALAIYLVGLILIAPRILRKRLVYVMIALGMLALVMMGLIALAAGISAEPEPLAETPEADPTMALSEITPEPEPLWESAAFTPPPRWVTIVATLSLGLMLVAGLLAVLWRLYVLRQGSTEPPLAQLAARAQAALDALCDGEEARDVVLRCYFEMVRVLDQTQDIRRVETVTPREFAVQLAALGLPEAPVYTLTRLFEDARYGTAISDDDVAQRAVASLEAIVAACEAVA